MDRTGPTDHFRPFQISQTLQKRKKNQSRSNLTQIIVKNHTKILSSIPFGGLFVLWLTSDILGKNKWQNCCECSLQLI